MLFTAAFYVYPVLTLSEVTFRWLVVTYIYKNPFKISMHELLGHNVKFFFVFCKLVFALGNY